jgi:hypothetical protein
LLSLHPSRKFRSGLPFPSPRREAQEELNTLISY